MRSASLSTTATAPVLFYGSGLAAVSSAPSVASATMHHALIALPAEASQVRPARKFTTTHLARWGVTDTDRDRAELIVSELAGNAVRHGRSDMTVHLSLIDRSLHIDVIDTGRLRGARSGATTAADEAGRGLSLVGLVADWTDIRREKHGWQAHVGLRVARQRDDSLSMDMVDSPAPASADFGR